VACHSDNGWRFISPVDGLELVDRASGRCWRFVSGAWLLGIVKASEIQINGVKVLGAQRPTIPNVSGGTTIDSEARNTLAQVLTSLRAHDIIAAQGEARKTQARHFGAQAKLKRELPPPLSY
jgi:hypothetical protein